MTAQTPSSAPRPLNGQTATIASLSRREKKPDQGEKRRKQVAAVLGTVGGVGSVMAVKSAAMAMALWAGAPALVVAGVGLAAVMATSGTVSYFKQRKAQKAAGHEAPFSVKDMFKSMFTSKAALVAGGMTALAAALPGALVVAASSGVAAFGAGLYEYKSQRAAARARGVDVGPASVRDAFNTIFKSKSAGKAFLISAGIGTVLSLVTGTSWSPAEQGPAPQAAAEGLDTALQVADNSPASESPAPALTPSAEPGAPMPEMAAASPDVSASAPASTPAAAEAAPAVEAPSHESSLDEREVLVERAAPQAPAPASASVPQATEATADEPAAHIEMPARDEIIFDNTGPDGVRQILYGSGIIETITPIDAPVDVAPTDAAPEPAVEAPAETSHDAAAEPVGPLSATYGEAAQVAAPAESLADVPETNVPGEAIGQCEINETDDEVRVDCKLDLSAEMKPGASIDFRTAAHPEVVMSVAVSADADPINAGEFLEEKALPKAMAAYEQGHFKP